MTPVDVTMPRLSDSMEEGTIAKWLVAVGDEVAKGQPLAEIDTDKATVVYESDAEGTVLEILVADGETAAVGQAVARLGVPSEPGEARAETAVQAAPERGPPNASPVARRLARERGVDLAALSGTGPGGMVTRTDVERAGETGDAAQPAPSSETRLQELTRVQHTIARRMVEGASAPTFSIEADLELTPVVALRDSLAAGEKSALSLNDLVVKAAALALREFPRLNGTYAEDGFRLHDRVNVGIAVATDDALLVPVVRDADRKPLEAIAGETRELAAKAREGTLAPAELDGGTFTVTNLGMLGVRRFVPILNPPQAAILSVGAVAARPVVDEQGEIAALDMASFTLVCDHRIVYGAEAARFLGRVGELLAQPELLAEG